MIDGTKLRIHEQAQRRLRSHPLLAGRWRSRGVGKSGHERFTATWNGWTFTGDATRCGEFRGSFHKFHHGGTNWQDFTHGQFVATVAALRDAFGLHPAGLTIAGLEIGPNIVPPIPTRDVLRAIVLHKTTAPTPMRKGHGIEIVHETYRFKVYDKAAQHREHVPGELLRFEVKANKMRPLVGCNVRTVADLLDPAAWTRLCTFLLGKFDELLIVEPHMPTDALRPAQRDFVAKASDPAYWQAMDSRTRWKRRRDLDAIHAQHAPHGLKATLRKLIAAKLSDLNDGDKCTDGTTARPEAQRVTNAPTGQLPTVTPSEGQKATNAPLALRGANVPFEGSGMDAVEVPAGGVRRCPVCGRDISDQDPRSRVCSERIYGKAGKRCRNALSNRSLSLRRMGARGGLLFDHGPFIAPPGRVAGPVPGASRGTMR